MTTEPRRECFRVDDLLIDVGAVAVWRGEEQLAVPDLSFSTLALLIRRAPDVVSPDELVEAVWEGMAVSDETITQRIALLRRALGDDWRDPRYIRSVRGRGYQLVPAPERVEGRDVTLAESEPVERVAEPNRSRARRRRPQPLLWVTTVSAILLVVALVAFIRSSSAPAAGTPAIYEPEVSSSDLVARAREYFDLHREQDNERAIKLLQQALERNPDDPLALAGLSLAFGQRSAKFNQPIKWAREAEGFARQAIALDPTLAEAHHALGLALDAQGRQTAALASYRQAVELDPRHLRALAAGAYVLSVRGELAEALRWNLQLLQQGENLHYLEVQIADTLAALDFSPSAEVWYEKAVTLRPDNLFAATAFAAYRLSRGDLTGAEALIGQAVEAGVERPELFELRGHLAAMQGDIEKAREMYRQAVEVSARSSATERLLALAVKEDPDTYGLEAQTTIAEIDEGLRAGSEWPPSAIDIAILATAAGDHPAATTAIDRAIGLGYRNSAWLLVDPALADLREDAGFWPRIERIGDLVGREREVVLAADWLPPGFLDPVR
ncbi:MAG: winged helix-turn-helix domain-containing protein [Thermoanaerobaculia bacterium]